jgi:hypothetical protein
MQRNGPRASGAKTLQQQIVTRSVAQSASTPGITSGPTTCTWATSPVTSSLAGLRSSWVSRVTVRPRHLGTGGCKLLADAAVKPQKDLVNAAARCSWTTFNETNPRFDRGGPDSVRHRPRSCLSESGRCRSALLLGYKADICPEFDAAAGQGLSCWHGASAGVVHYAGLSSS